MTDAERFGVKQHDRQPRRLFAAIDPGVIGAALDHDVAGAELHACFVHIHIDLARKHDDVIDRLGAVHFGGDAGREFHDDKARTIFRRRGAENTCAHVLDVFADRDIGRHGVGAPHQCRRDSFPRRLDVGCRPLADHLGDVLAVMTGDDAADRYAGHGKKTSGL
jgi:hypothetical protein